MATSLKERIKAELDEIMLSHDGLLNPSHVVERARDPRTTLHSQFVWDNSEAAERYRLWQARQIISSYQVVCETPRGPVQVSAYVSLPEDRKAGARAARLGETGGGYRAIGEVLSLPEHRRQLFEQASAEFRQWRAKYSTIMLLQPVFKAFDAVSAKAGRRRAAKKRVHRPKARRRTASMA